MGKIVIYSDSTCDLSKELIEESGVIIMPLCINFGDEVFHDGVDISPSSLFKKVEETNMLPKTSAASVGDYIKIFQSEIDKGNDVIMFAISSGFSSTYQNALLARDEVDSSRVEVIDSMNLSSAIGLEILRAARLRDEGKNIHEIKVEVDSMREKVKCSFAIETLEYLYKGGRCSGVSRLVGTLLKLKPIIAVRHGKMEVAAKTIGKKKALNYMLDEIRSNKENVELKDIMVTHVLADEDAKYLIEKLHEDFPTARINETHAGAIVSSHCGPGTIGILYVLK